MSVPTLRAIVVLAPTLAVCATAVQGPAPRLLLVALVALLALGAAYRPESVLLTVCLGLVLGWWALATHRGEPDAMVPDAMVPVAMVPAAWAVLAAHLAATLLGYGPPELTVGRDLLRRWRPRAALLAALPPVLWALAAVVHGRPLVGAWPVGLVGAAGLCVVAGLAVRRTPSEIPSETPSDTPSRIASRTVDP